METLNVLIRSKCYWPRYVECRPLPLRHFMATRGLGLLCESHGRTADIWLFVCRLPFSEKRYGSIWCVLSLCSARFEAASGVIQCFSLIFTTADLQQLKYDMESDFVVNWNSVPNVNSSRSWIKASYTYRCQLFGVRVCVAFMVAIFSHITSFWFLGSD